MIDIINDDENNQLLSQCTFKYDGFMKRCIKKLVELEGNFSHWYCDLRDLDKLVTCLDAFIYNIEKYNKYEKYIIDNNKDEYITLKKYVWLLLHANYEHIKNNSKCDYCIRLLEYSNKIKINSKVEVKNKACFINEYKTYIKVLVENIHHYEINESLNNFQKQFENYLAETNDFTTWLKNIPGDNKLEEGNLIEWSLSFDKDKDKELKQKLLDDIDNLQIEKLFYGSPNNEDFFKYIDNIRKDNTRFTVFLNSALSKIITQKIYYSKSVNNDINIKKAIVLPNDIASLLEDLINGEANKENEKKRKANIIEIINKNLRINIPNNNIPVIQSKIEIEEIEKSELNQPIVLPEKSNSDNKKQSIKKMLYVLAAIVGVSAVACVFFYQELLKNKLSAINQLFISWALRKVE